MTKITEETKIKLSENRKKKKVENKPLNNPDVLKKASKTFYAKNKPPRILINYATDGLINNFKAYCNANNFTYAEGLKDLLKDK